MFDFNLLCNELDVVVEKLVCWGFKLDVDKLGVFEECCKVL